MVGQCLSPESTVTSLLSSSGYLRSSLAVPEHTTTFRYKHKRYDSASAALNAYIADFNSSHPAEKTLTGNLSASHRLPPTPSTPRATTLRNKDVLREHLTDRELDVLSLPDISLAYSPTRNRVSMTTDELLSIPYDGSMPVTHTSAFIQGLLSPPAAPQPPSRPARRAHSGSLSTHAIPEVSQQVPPRRRPSSSRFASPRRRWMWWLWKKLVTMVMCVCSRVEEQQQQQQRREQRDGWSHPHPSIFITG